jgi:hypothetical protein
MRHCGSAGQPRYFHAHTTRPPSQEKAGATFCERCSPSPLRAWPPERAQAATRNLPIHRRPIVVPFTAGSATDITAHRRTQTGGALGPAGVTTTPERRASSPQHRREAEPDGHTSW